MYSTIWSLLVFSLINVAYGQIPTCKLNIGVYYETKCPDSKHFIVHQLMPTYKAVGQIMNIDMVPFGKASYQLTPNGTSYTFNCQHGPSECQGNRMQACAKKQLEFDKLMELVNCMEKTSAPERNLDQCGKEVGVSTASIKQCSSGVEGAKLLKDLGDMTYAVSPKVSFVPALTINGAHDSAFENEAFRNLKKAVCDRCEGVKPAGCSTA